VFVGCGACPWVVEFSASVKANCQWYVSSDVLEIYFRFVRIDFVSIALACLLKSVRAGQHAIGAGRNQVLLSCYAVLLEKTVNESSGGGGLFLNGNVHISLDAASMIRR
jgi:hypothetical protein